MTPTIDLHQQALPESTRSHHLLRAFGMFDAVGLERISAIAIDQFKPTDCIRGLTIRTVKRRWFTSCR